MAITRDDVLHVAKLARLELSEPEVEQMTEELGQILGYVEQLREVDTSQVEPTASVAVASAPLREDRACAGVSSDRALAGAPRTAEGSFAVPGFVEEG